MSRLFTFGCSFTKYVWPTWADIVSLAFDEYENWGQMGAGNQFIFNSLIECDVKNNLTQDDTVCIMWSSMAREDRYIAGKWVTLGNVYIRGHGEMIDQHYLDNYADTRGFYIRDLAVIYATKKILDSIGCKYVFTSIVDLTNPIDTEKSSAESVIDDLLEQYKDTLEKIRPSVHQVVFNYDWYSRPLLPEIELKKTKAMYIQVAGEQWPSWEDFYQNNLANVPSKIIKELNNLKKWDWKKMIRNSQRSDLHPTPFEHLEYVQKVMPEFIITDDTVERIKLIDYKLRNNEPFYNLWKPIKIERW